MGGIMSVLASEKKIQTDQKRKEVQVQVQVPSEEQVSVQKEEQVPVQKEVQVPVQKEEQVPSEVPVQEEEQEQEQTRIELMKKLENEGMEKLQALKNAENGIILTEKSLTDIMQSGGDEFEKQMGRKMTYSEMREMYG